MKPDKIFSKKEAELIFREEGIKKHEKLDVHRMLCENAAKDYIKKRGGKQL